MEDGDKTETTLLGTVDLKREMKLQFYSTEENSECGRLYQNEKGKLCFDGNVEKSALIFFEYLCELWNKESK